MAPNTLRRTLRLGDIIYLNVTKQLPVFQAIFDPPTPAPVSYTHLDVYKRQVTGGAECQRQPLEIAPHLNQRHNQAVPVARGN